MKSALLLAACLLFPAIALAQPGRDDRGGRPSFGSGGSRGGFGSSGSRDDDRRDDDRRREEERRREEWRRREEERRREVESIEPRAVDYRLRDDLQLPPGFDIPEDSPLFAKGPLEERYDRRIMDRLNQSIREYDTDRDGFISMKETRGRFSNAQESDLDGDGKLSRVELAERYVERYGGNEKAKSASKRKSVATAFGGFEYSADSGSAKLDDAAQARLDRTMRYIDKNEDGVVDEKEIREGRWSSDPKKYDKNGDGKLTRDELAQRAIDQTSNDRSRGGGGSSSTKRAKSQFGTWKRPPRS